MMVQDTNGQTTHSCVMTTKPSNVYSNPDR